MKTIVWVVRDQGGEYISRKQEGKRTSTSIEAKEFETREQAQEACVRLTDRVLSREVSR